MARGVLTEEVMSLMKSLDFEGTVRELRLMPYLMVKLLDNRYPSNISSEERKILIDWKTKSWIIEDVLNESFVITENLLDRIYKVLKVGYCSDVLEYTNHNHYVIFEGCDGSGKTSIMKGLWNDIDLHKYHISDRSFISDFIYAKKFNRNKIHNIDVKVYYDYHLQRVLSLPDLKIVVCIADKSVLYDRCIKKDDPIIQDKERDLAESELSSDNDLFKNYTIMLCKKYDIPIKVIDTTNETLKESILKVKNFILGE